MPKRTAGFGKCREPGQYGSPEEVSYLATVECVAGQAAGLIAIPNVGGNRL